MGLIASRGSSSSKSSSSKSKTPAKSTAYAGAPKTSTNKSSASGSTKSGGSSNTMVRLSNGLQVSKSYADSKGYSYSTGAGSSAAGAASAQTGKTAAPAQVAGAQNGMKASDYLKSNYIPASAYSGDPLYANVVGRLKNGVMVDKSYVQSHPDAVIYPMTYKTSTYYGDNPNISDAKKAELDWNHGVSPGYNTISTPEYNAAYQALNNRYGVAADDEHPLSAGQKSGVKGKGSTGGTGQSDHPSGGTGVLPPYMGGTGGIPDYSIPGDADSGSSDDGAQRALRDYEETLQKLKEAQAKALRERAQQAADQIRAQKDPLRQTYDKAAQQAYILKRTAQKTLPEQLSAQGLTGGLTESANLALETNYDNNLNELTGRYGDNLVALERDAQEVLNSGDLSIAENAGKYDQLLADHALKLEQQARDAAVKKELTKLQANLQLRNQQQIEAMQQRDAYARYLAQQGYSSSQIAQILDAWM